MSQHQEESTSIQPSEGDKGIHHEAKVDVPSVVVKREAILNSDGPGSGRPGFRGGQLEQDSTSGSGISGKTSSSNNLSDSSGSKGLKRIGRPPSKPRLSIDALGPFIVDRTELQSPIKLENEIPEVAKIVVASIQEDLMKKREASFRNLTVLPTSESSIPSSTTTNQPRKTSFANLASVSPTTSSIPENDPISTTSNEPSIPSIITQVTQSSSPIDRPNLDSAIQKAGKIAAAQYTSEATNTDTSPKPDQSTGVTTLSAVSNDTQPKQEEYSPPISIWRKLFPCFCFPEKTKKTGIAGSTTVPMSDLSAKKPVTPLGVITANDGAIFTDDVNFLLPPPTEEDKDKKCLVLDLDETLLHSSFKPVETCDFTIPVEIDNIVHTVYVLKRPHVAEFLETVAKQYELVIFTASLSKYADPVLDILDPKRLIKHRLFRESCTHIKGNYIKDLALLGRDLASTIIIDNSPTCYMLQPFNAVPITSWFDDLTDQELLDLIPFLSDLTMVEDVREVLSASITPPQSAGSAPSPINSSLNSPITQVQP